MKPVLRVIVKTLRLLAWLPLLLITDARADAYGDVEALLSSRQFAQALSQADAYLAKQPTDPQMRFLKGVTQSHLGRQDDALATFIRLTEDYPELPEPYNNLAVIEAARGEFDKALAALQMALRTRPDYAVARENLADVHIRLAEHAYRRALALDPASTTLKRKLALTHELATLTPLPAASGVKP